MLCGSEVPISQVPGSSYHGSGSGRLLWGIDVGSIHVPGLGNANVILQLYSLILNVSIFNQMRTFEILLHNLLTMAFVGEMS